MNRLAQLLSLVLMPVVPGFIIALFAALRHEGGLTLRLVGVAGLVTALVVGVPLLSLGVAYAFFGSDDLFGKRRATRRFFYPAAVAGLLGAAWVFTRIEPFPLAVKMAAAAGAVVVLLALTNRRLKTSIHTAGNAGIGVAIVHAYGPYAAVYLLIVPLVAWARIRTGHHTLSETIVGALVGVDWRRCGATRFVPRGLRDMSRKRPADKAMGP